MDVPFSPDTEAQLRQLAESQGKAAPQLVNETVTRLLERHAEFIEGVQRGMEAARRGDVISHEEVVAGIYRLLQS